MLGRTGTGESIRDGDDGRDRSAGDPRTPGNSFADDMLPIVSPDGKTLYFARKRHPENVGDEKRDDIWYSKLQADGSWGPAIHMEDPLNNEHHNYVAWVSRTVTAWH